MASPAAEEERTQHLMGHCSCGHIAYVIDISPASVPVRGGSSSASQPSPALRPAGLNLAAACHCTRCQRLNGAPYVWTTHWKEDAVKWFPPPRTFSPSNSDDEGEAVDDDDEQETPDDEMQETSDNGSGSQASIDVDDLKDQLQNTSIKPEPLRERFSMNLATYELVPGRKWKLRCRKCGNPMGSWNEAKKQWSIWPFTLAREPCTSGATHPDGPIPGFNLLKPTDHIFYSWRSTDVIDGLPKWAGYPGGEAVAERRTD